jgi:phage terminase large subunit-like protein
MLAGYGKPTVPIALEFEQLPAVPNAAHDDMCDAMSQAAVWLLKTRGPRVTISNMITGTILEQYY